MVEAAQPTQGCVKVGKCVILNRSEGSFRTRDRTLRCAQSDNLAGNRVLDRTLTEPWQPTDIIASSDDGYHTQARLMHRHLRVR